MPNVIIVSNRLPVSVKKTDKGLEISPSDGGLATGLGSYARGGSNKWIGWPGIVSDNLTEKEKQTIATQLRKYNCYPVFLTQKQLDAYYNGYSNNILWPFFHGMPADYTNQDKYWAAYRRVNQQFCDAVLALSKPRSSIWVHDYQLLLLPAMLRAERPHDTIGFFLHIPFPDAQSFKQLAQGRHLLKGILGADLAGFHTSAYADNFLDACHELDIGIAARGQVILPGRTVRVTHFPMGIDYGKFARAGSSLKVRKEVLRYKQKYRQYKIILTLDRLDPSKGFVERLEAYQEFLEQNPSLHGKVIMLMLAIPSRTEIAVYKQLKQRVDELIATINRRYGTNQWQPVHFMFKSIPFEQVSALYQIADVAFVAPIRDGMNLVAKEYIASKSNSNGVLILSKTAGAAQELKEALLVNPHKQAALVKALTKAMTMQPRELKRRLHTMQTHLSDNTVQDWAGTFMKSLQSSGIGLQSRAQHLSGKRQDALLSDYAPAQNRLVLLDYDGVLAPFVDDPKNATPSQDILTVVKKLASHKNNHVVIVSGRHKDILEKWFGTLPVGIAAEHGAMIKLQGQEWHPTSPPADDWKNIIRPVLEKYAKNTPGAFLEEKEFSLVWHYRKSPPYHAQKNVAIIKRTLRPVVKSFGVELFSGNKILEIKSPHAHKGSVIKHWLKDLPDFIMVIGDDYTDEDMFAAVPPHSYAIKVGRGKTYAPYRLKSPAEVLSLLTELAKK